MLMRHLNLSLPMETDSTHDERSFSVGAANMPVPYHLDESDSDSIVSATFSPCIAFSHLCFAVKNVKYTSIKKRDMKLTHVMSA